MPASRYMARSPLPHTAVAGASPQGEVSDRSIALNLLISLRPTQWTKNLVAFAGLIFGQKLFDPRAAALSVEAFAVLCALSGAVYLVNDVIDRDADRHHPLKAARPIAAGALSPPTALATAVILAVAALGAAFSMRPAFAAVAAGYTALLVIYSAVLKHVVILDVLTVAAGFVLRAAAGAVAIDVPISNWLLVCTILLALFLVLSKRRHEVLLLAGGATDHRPILEQYSPYLLDQMIAVVTASTLISYAFYSFSPETISKFGTDRLGLTLPFPLYGIFRYLYLVHHQKGGGDPADMLLRDRPLLACVGLWAVTVVLLIYRPFAAGSQ